MGAVILYLDVHEVYYITDRFFVFVFLICFVSQDKRREVGARTHAAARAREDAADGLDMKEADTMGGGDSFRDAMARTKHGQKRRQTAKTVRVRGTASYFVNSWVFGLFYFCVLFVCYVRLC